MPKVNPGESEKDFVARCIPIVIKEGATKEQAAGKCFGIYRNAHKVQDGRPPKKWFDETVAALKRKGGIDDPEALAGWIWFHQKQSAEKEKKKSCKTIEKVQRKTVRGYLSPSPGDISEKENDILAEVYAKSREDGYDKERASKIAWGAVNRYKNKSAAKSKMFKLAKSIIDNYIEKAKEGQKKMIFGRPFRFSGGKWIPENEVAPKKEKPKKKTPYEYMMRDYGEGRVHEYYQDDLNAASKKTRENFLKNLSKVSDEYLDAMLKEMKQGNHEKYIKLMKISERD